LLTATAGQAVDEPVSLTAGAVDPDGAATMAPGGNLSVRIEYRSDQVLHIQARGYRGGREVPGMMNASPGYGPGSGAALSWISYRNEADVDEVRVVAHDNRWRRLAEVSIPVQVRWRAGAPVHVPASWVGEMNKVQQAALSESLRRAENGPLAPLWSLLGMALIGSVPGYLVAQVVTLLLWRGAWRVGAAAPLLFMVPALLFSLYAFAKESNLWPIWLIFLSPVALFYLGVLFLARRVRSRAGATL
jgi:hypothetical protein